ncbi:VPLPA-CTERM sorting domain-containing protein [Desulfobulbus elongatus]|uniref:VPLPA-CTERM sorting domain-containing protein n=1 Tax=Desulfobulbus elongatus TaxID=53332 RepID=UPI000B0C8695|nr:VPLPA-CTERM sorting domain-containing protein [Desulfobulbus elongatus]
MRKIFAGIMLLAISSTAQAAAYNFNGTWIEVEGWAGTGENETILVVDWNRLDNGEATVSESHAFGFRWDGTAHVSDMLTALNEAGILTATGTSFLYNIGYNDTRDGEYHLHIEEGSWNLASTSDPYANWGTWGNSEWDFNSAGMTEELLADGQYEGINAIMWFGSLPEYADDQLNIPFAAAPVPVPAAAWLLGTGIVGLLGIRRRQLSEVRG